MHVLNPQPGRWRGSVMLLLLAALFVPTMASAQSAGSTAKRRAPCADCESEIRRTKALERLDSLQWEFEHERLTDEQRERLRREMALAVRELQAAIGNLRVEMGDLERAQAEAWAGTPRIAYSFSTKPRGYLGVSFEGPNTEDFRGEERIIRFLTYPRISLVEPSSPAETAGIRVGDTLVAMNGVDVLEREISLTKMLVPDAQLLVRLRRDGSARELKVTVGKAPAYVVQRVMPPMAPLPAEAPRAVAGVRSPQAVRAPGSVSVSGTAAPSVWVYSDGVAGAKVETITEGIAKAVGVERGVFVLRAGPGTPAGRSGLRDGDIIVRAAGQPVATVRELRAALERHDGSGGVKLVILRERKQRELTLRQ